MFRLERPCATLPMVGAIAVTAGAGVSIVAEGKYEVELVALTVINTFCLGS